MLSDIQEEVESQPDLLGAFARKALPCLKSGSLLVGAGDSFIAAKCAELLSSFRCIAVDPYVLLSSPSLSRKRAVTFISVSGRTKSNIAAAEKVKGIACRTLCLTADSHSPLSEATEETLTIPYRYRPRVPGTLSFTLSLTAALKLSSSYKDCRFQSLFDRARADASTFRFADLGTTFFLGNHLAYAASLYAAAKTYEFFGGKAQAQLLEEFSHLELFSLQQQDRVNIFSHADPLEAGARLERTLRVKGYSATLVKSQGRNPVEQAFHAVFTAQLASIARMRDLGHRSPYFMKSGEKLGASDSMIY